VPIKTAWVFPILGGATGTAYFDLIQLMQFSPGPGAVTFMFDDGYKSTKSVAKPILDKYRFVGSSAAISSVVAAGSDMTAQDLRDLQAAGWDIASHSVTHPSMIGLSTTAAKNELQNSKSTLTGFGLTIDSFVWPYGDYNQSLIGLTQVGLPTAPLYKSARNVEFDDNAYGTFPYGLRSTPRRSGRCNRGSTT
jgi:peptidoglycan/xylan/chitin deacetylase (PgdA/CDA1 family)